jgi:hypothetical protein
MVELVAEGFDQQVYLGAFFGQVGFALTEGLDGLLELS